MRCHNGHARIQKSRLKSDWCTRSPDSNWRYLWIVGHKHNSRVRRFTKIRSPLMRSCVFLLRPQETLGQYCGVVGTTLTKLSVVFGGMSGCRACDLTATLLMLVPRRGLVPSPDTRSLGTRAGGHNPTDPRPHSTRVCRKSRDRGLPHAFNFLRALFQPTRPPARGT